jgi:hypothetical protein
MTIFRGRPSFLVHLLSATCFSCVFFGYVAVCPLFVCVSGVPVCVLSGRETTCFGSYSMTIFRGHPSFLVHLLPLSCLLRHVSCFGYVALCHLFVCVSGVPVCVLSSRETCCGHYSMTIFRGRPSFLVHPPPISRLQAADRWWVH